MHVRSITSLAVGVGAIAVAFSAGIAVRDLSTPSAPRAAVGQKADIVAEIRDDLRTRYVEPLPSSVLSAPSAQALLARLHDPYTVYLTPRDYALLRTETVGYVGLGLRLTPTAHHLRVLGAIPGSPAAVARLAGGDTILAIDGVSTRTLSMTSALRRLKGQAGSHVKLRVLRAGGHNPTLITLTLTRRNVVLQDVTWRDVGKGASRTRVIAISEFSLGVAAKVRKAARGAHRVVLDLRGDRGGLLSEAIATADVFLKKGRIVSWSGAHMPVHVMRASGNALPKMPLAVLVNRGTASAAEIVAAALQDNHRAIVVGTRTYGKASVQEIEPLDDGGALKLTIATYYTPKGRDLHGHGVQPDVYAPRHALQRALHTFVAA